MDWANERYVRVYVRDTKTWKLLGWEGQAVLCLLARRFDRSGLLDDVKDGEDVALMIGSGFPTDVAKRGLQKILELKVMIIVNDGLFWPKFMEAQETAMSDAQRQRESRANRRSRASLDNVPVTNRDKKSNNVTACHGVSRRVTPSRAVPSVLNLTKRDGNGKRAHTHSKKSAKRATQIPENWNPTEKHVELALELGVVASDEAKKFIDHAIANGRTLKSWDAGFRMWLRKSVEYSLKHSPKSAVADDDYLDNWAKQKEKGHDTRCDKKEFEMGFGLLPEEIRKNKNDA